MILRCKLCGEVIQRGYTNMIANSKIHRQEITRAEKQEEFEKAPLLPEEKQKDYEYFFSEEYTHDNGYFNDWEEFSMTGK